MVFKLPLVTVHPVAGEISHWYNAKVLHVPFVAILDPGLEAVPSNTYMSLRQPLGEFGLKLKFAIGLAAILIEPTVTSVVPQGFSALAFKVKAFPDLPHELVWKVCVRLAGTFSCVKVYGALPSS